MSWRNHKSHREETKAVKEALRKRGIDAKVGHGTGTAWGWLEIRPVSYPKELNDWQTRRAVILSIVRQITGRHGDYNGEVLVD